MNALEAMAKLYSLALFGPGANVQGSSATFANVLLRAERALADAGLSETPLPLELAALRENLTQRQALLQQVHDALARDQRRKLKPHERCGHSACSQHYIDTGRSECVEPTHKQARGSRAEREARGDDPGR